MSRSLLTPPELEANILDNTSTSSLHECAAFATLAKSRFKDSSSQQAQNAGLPQNKLLATNRTGIDKNILWPMTMTIISLKIKLGCPRFGAPVTCPQTWDRFASTNLWRGTPRGFEIDWASEMPKINQEILNEFGTHGKPHSP